MPDDARSNIGRSLFTTGRMTDTASQADIENFITRRQASQAAERANYQLFLSELCDVFNIARPEPAGQDDAQNAYVSPRRRYDLKGSRRMLKPHTSIAIRVCRLTR